MVEKIKELCKRDNVSIRQVEVRCDFGNGTIAKWDQYRPSVDKVAKVAKFFNKPMEYFIED